MNAKRDHFAASLKSKIPTLVLVSEGISQSHRPSASTDPPFPNTMSDAHAAQQDDKKKKKKSRGTFGKSTPTQEIYLAKMAKKHLGTDSKDAHGKIIKNKDKLTISKTALSEVALLMNDAVNTFAFTAEKMLAYSGQNTLGKKTAECATYMALSGLLRENATKAGERAVEAYDNWVAPEA